jgi:excisionase family DNA binding protein
VSHANQPFDIVEHLSKTNRVLTAPELANLLNVSTKTVYKLTASNTLPAVRIGTSIRFNPASVVLWLRTVGNV